MFKSSLFKKFFFPLIFAVSIYALAVYFFSVPYLKKVVYDLEEKSEKTILQNVHELVKVNHLSIEAYKQSVLSAHKKQLKNIVLFQEAFLKSMLNSSLAGEMREDETKIKALEELRLFKYDDDNFVWVADYNCVFISHPDNQFYLKDFSAVKDDFGKFFMKTIVESARTDGEGYASFWWRRSKDMPAEKLSYFRLFPQWEMVIGSDVYLDDLEADVIMRKEKMIDDLRKVLKQITIGETGFMYIFDSFQNIIIHPDARLENTNMSGLKNPVTGNSIASDLIAASRNPEQKYYYKWNRPDDPEHYIYDKIAWVRYLEGFDWYIVSSVYTDELNRTSVNLRNNILTVSATMFLLTIMIINMLVRRLLKPIHKLSTAAGKVRAGDLNARCDVESKDEIGYMASLFNMMVVQLKSHIEHLDQKVLKRTKELDEKNEKLEIEISERKRMQEEVSEANRKLTVWVGKLEQHNMEITQLNVLSEKLQACQTLQETFEVVSDSIPTLFSQASGALFSFDETSDSMKKVASWGNYPDIVKSVSPSDCMGLRLESIFIVEKPGDGEVCNHIQLDPPFISLCLPLTGNKEKLGMLHLQFAGPIKQVENTTSFLEERKMLATTVVDHLSLAQANLKLRERLHQMSVRDALTGLFNRRYMEETLELEFKRAQRKQSSVSVIMIDVDFFKKFNDTYGHEAGDVVLAGLARQMCSKMRKEDVVCRYGGEEFLIIIPDCPLQYAEDRAEALRVGVENDLRLEYREHVFKLTISVGVAAFPENGKTIENILNSADEALYKAKQKGRNCVVLSDNHIS